MKRKGGRGAPKVGKVITRSKFVGVSYKREGKVLKVDYKPPRG